MSYIQPTDGAVTTKTADYTAVEADDTILLDGTTASVTLTLPSAAAVVTGKRYVIKCINQTNPCTISPDGVETIDGKSSLPFKTVNDAWVLVSDGTNWLISS